MKILLQGLKAVSIGLVLALVIMVGVVLIGWIFIHLMNNLFL